MIHAANIHDTKSEILVAQPACEKYPSIADAGYRGTFVIELEEKCGIGVDISEKIKPHEWAKMPWRWIMERTFSWLTHSRRLSKDYEILCDSAAAMVKLSHIHTMLIRNL